MVPGVGHIRRLADKEQIDIVKDRRTTTREFSKGKYVDV
jgi:hypothetical protein